MSRISQEALQGNYDQRLDHEGVGRNRVATFEAATEGLRGVVLEFDRKERARQMELDDRMYPAGHMARVVSLDAAREARAQQEAAALEAARQQVDAAGAMQATDVAFEPTEATVVSMPERTQVHDSVQSALSSYTERMAA